MSQPSLRSERSTESRYSQIKLINCEIDGRYRLRHTHPHWLIYKRIGVVWFRFSSCECVHHRDTIACEFRHTKVRCRAHRQWVLFNSWKIIPISIQNDRYYGLYLKCIFVCVSAKEIKSKAISQKFYDNRFVIVPIQSLSSQFDMFRWTLLYSHSWVGKKRNEKTMK